MWQWRALFCQFVHDRQLTSKTKIKVQTKSGIVEPELGENGWVRVKYGLSEILATGNSIFGRCAGKPV